MSKKSFPNTSSKFVSCVSFMFSLEVIWFHILHLGVWSILGYILCMMRVINQSSFFARGYSIVSTLFVKTTIFSLSLSFCQKSVVHIYGKSHISGFSILFHSSLDLYISTTLSWLLRLFVRLEIILIPKCVFCKVVLALVLPPFHFWMNFRTSLSVSTTTTKRLQGFWLGLLWSVDKFGKTT